MKRIILILIIVLLLSFQLINISCFNGVDESKKIDYWIKSFKNSKIIVSSIEDANDGLIFVGNKIFDDLKPTKMIIFKTDYFGNLLWAKNYSINDDILITKIIKSSDNNFIICGVIRKKIFSEIDKVYMDTFNPLLIKIDKNGIIIWAKEYEFFRESDKMPFLDPSITIIEGNKEEYVVSINSSDIIGEGAYFCIFKVNNNGEIIWSKIGFGIESTTYSFLSKTNDGGYILIGSSIPFHIRNNFFLIKITSKGDIAWSKYYRGKENTINYIKSIIQDREGNFLIAGVTLDLNKESLLLIKYNEKKNIIWYRNYCFDEFGDKIVPKKIILSDDNGYYIVGYLGNSKIDKSESFIMKLDNNGKLIFIKTFSLNKNFYIGLDLKQINKDFIFISLEGLNYDDCIYMDMYRNDLKAYNNSYIMKLNYNFEIADSCNYLKNLDIKTKIISSSDKFIEFENSLDSIFTVQNSINFNISNENLNFKIICSNE